MITPKMLSQEPSWSNITYALAVYLAFTLPSALFIIILRKPSFVRWAWAPFNTSRGMAMGQATVAAVQCLNLLLITKLDDTGLIGVKLYRESAGLRSRLFRTWAFFLNFRGDGTTWEAKNVPYHAAYLQQNSTGQTLSRKRYILREIAIIIW
ncbi:unnamed protein product [Penicillium nalgiovense]|nr:unnamed protein product [Penicillium nalgiovense]